MQLRTRLVNSIQNKLKFCKLKMFFNHHVNWIRCFVIKIPLRKRSALSLFTDNDIYRLWWNIPPLFFPLKLFDWKICWLISTVHRHVAMMYWNWWKVYCYRIVSVFKHMFSFFMLLTCKIFNSSDDALLARAKLQSFDKKHGLVNWICI